MKLTSTEPLNPECFTDRVPASGRGVSPTLRSESSVPVHSGSLQLHDLLSQLCHVYCQQVQLHNLPYSVILRRSKISAQIFGLQRQLPGPVRFPTLP